MRWVEDASGSDGVLERRFVVDGKNGSIPGVTWWPKQTLASAPLVLVGHGGTMHKTSPQLREVGRSLVAGGVVVAAIDGPVHGERRPNGADPDDHSGVWADYSALLEKDGGDAVAAGMVADWRAAIDGLSDVPELHGRSVGYWGMSMGGRFGVPLVASDSRIEAAVLGMVGTNAAPSIADEAARIRCPVLFVLDSEDHLFPLDLGLALFLAVGSVDKRLHVFPGPHGSMPADEPSVMLAFLLDRLGAG